ncbi:MAG: CapA family protein [Fimbriimonas sp.]|nr:CapA family protein [Fimbriimonas sp.]
MNRTFCSLRSRCHVLFRVFLICTAALSAHGAALLFGGDIMLNGIVPSAKTLSDIKPLTRRIDVAFGNLEIPLTHATTKTARKSAAELKKKDQFILKADPSHIKFVKDAGIGMVTLANNHAMDYGRSGLREMTALLDRNKIGHAGAGVDADAAMSPAIRKLPSGQTVALLSVMAFQTTAALLKTTPATRTSPGVGVLNLHGDLGQKAQAKLKAWIANAHDGADWVVVGIHWGIERKPLPTPYQVGLGRALIDAGADVVWGNHPHVLQGAELYRGKLIMYSMGNLISNLPSRSGFIELKIDEEGNESPSFIPAEVKGGRVLLLRGKQKTVAFAGFRKLCHLLEKKYPSKRAVPMMR